MAAVDATNRLGEQGRNFDGVHFVACRHRHRVGGNDRFDDRIADAVAAHLSENGMRYARIDAACAGALENFRSSAERAGGLRHIVDE